MKKFNWQIFTSFNLLFTFLLMLLSGLILYVKPEGSIARWLDWEIIFLDKTAWESVHTIFSFLFAVFALFHILKIHIPNLAMYLHTKRNSTQSELFFSLALSLVFLIGTAINVVPFSSVYQAGNYISESWSSMNKPEIEKIDASTTIQQLSDYKNISVDSLISELKKSEISVVSKEKSFLELSKLNNTAPYKIYEMIAPLEGEKKTENNSYGQITLSELAFLFDIDKAHFLAKIRAKYNDPEINGETTLNQLGNRTNKSVQSIRKEILNLIDYNQ